MPFKVHAICAQTVVLEYSLPAFYLLNTVDGSMVHEGRLPGGFLHILNRPGGRWVLSGRDGNLPFDANGIGFILLRASFAALLVGSTANICSGRTNKERCAADK